MRLDLNVLRQKHIPLHIVLNLESLSEEDVSIAVNSFLEMTKTGFPILSIAIKLDNDNIECGKLLLQKIADSAIFEEQVRIFMIGDWYSLDHKFVERAKFLIDNTKSFDKHFLNILINYDGKTEITNSLKLISKKMELNQLKAEDINDTIIKENLFNSYFTPPELIVETSGKYSGIMLYDSVGSKIFFTNKKPGLLKEAINFFQS